MEESLLIIRTVVRPEALHSEESWKTNSSSTSTPSDSTDIQIDLHTAWSHFVETTPVVCDVTLIPDVKDVVWTRPLQTLASPMPREIVAESHTRMNNNNNNNNHTSVWYVPSQTLQPLGTTESLLWNLLDADGISTSTNYLLMLSSCHFQPQRGDVEDRAMWAVWPTTSDSLLTWEQQQHFVVGNDYHVSGTRSQYLIVGEALITMDPAIAHQTFVDRFWEQRSAADSVEKAENRTEDEFFAPNKDVANARHTIAPDPHMSNTPRQCPLHPLPTHSHFPAESLENVLRNELADIQRMFGILTVVGVIVVMAILWTLVQMYRERRPQWRPLSSVPAVRHHVNCAPKRDDWSPVSLDPSLAEQAVSPCTQFQLQWCQNKDVPRSRRWSSEVRERHLATAPPTPTSPAMVEVGDAILQHNDKNRHALTDLLELPMVVSLPHPTPRKMLVPLVTPDRLPTTSTVSKTSSRLPSSYPVDVAPRMRGDRTNLFLERSSSRMLITPSGPLLEKEATRSFVDEYWGGG